MSLRVLLLPTLVGLLGSNVLVAEELDVESALAAANATKSMQIIPLQDKHVHSSSIVELPDGSLLAAWFHGSGERKADDVCVYGARKASAEANWSEPFVLADTPGHPDCNPVLWIDKDQRLWLFWSAILSNEWESSLIKYRISDDYMSAQGPPVWKWQDTIHLKPNNLQDEMLGNWTQLLGTVGYLPRALHAEVSNFTFGEFLRVKGDDLLVVLLVLALINFSTYRVHKWRERRTGTGGWPLLVLRSCTCYAVMAVFASLAAVGYFAQQSGVKLNQRLGWMTANQPLQLESGEIILPLYSDRFSASLMAISSDGGTTWQASEALVGYGSIQPTLLQRSNGQLVAMMRENGARKRIRYSVSENQGRDWSPVAETDLVNPGSKVNVVSLKNGKWILAYNDVLDGRHALSLAISHDEGETWTPFHVLESVEPGYAAFSYPCIVETRDERIHITYSCQYRNTEQTGETIKHVSLEQPRRLATKSIVQTKRGVVRR